MSVFLENEWSYNLKKKKRERKKWNTAAKKEYKLTNMHLGVSYV